jgi:hypothetical protein
MPGEPTLLSNELQAGDRLVGMVTHRSALLRQRTLIGDTLC